MRKFEIDYLRKRIEEVVRCTNGNISTKLNKSKRGTGLTDAKKFAMIEKGTATVKNVVDLQDTRYRSNYSQFKNLLNSFDYPTTNNQKGKIAFNKRLESREEELHTEVELEGKRLLDKAILGIVATEDIPKELYKLGEMVNLINN